MTRTNLGQFPDVFVDPLLAEKSQRATAYADAMKMMGNFINAPIADMQSNVGEIGE